MTKRFPNPVIIGLVAALSFALSGPLSAQTEFRGRMFTGGGPNQPQAVNVRIVINGYSSLEEIRGLNNLLARDDVDGFWSMFRQNKKASIQFIGGLGLNVGLNIACEQVTDKGTKILLASESRDILSGTTKRVHGSFQFLVLELELDKNYQGEAKVYEDANIAFTPEGAFKIDSYVTTPKMIVNLKKSK